MRQSVLTQLIYRLQFLAYSYRIRCLRILLTLTQYGVPPEFQPLFRHVVILIEVLLKNSLRLMKEPGNWIGWKVRNRRRRRNGFWFRFRFWFVLNFWRDSEFTVAIPREFEWISGWNDNPRNRSAGGFCKPSVVCEFGTENHVVLSRRTLYRVNSLAWNVLLQWCYDRSNHNETVLPIGFSCPRSVFDSQAFHSRSLLFKRSHRSAIRSSHSHEFGL